MSESTALRRLANPSPASSHTPSSVPDLLVAGSLATGEYVQGVSDLDLVALVEGRLDSAREAVLVRIHQDLDRGLAGDLGCVYVEGPQVERHRGAAPHLDPRSPRPSDSLRGYSCGTGTSRFRGPRPPTDGFAAAHDGRGRAYRRPGRTARLLGVGVTSPHHLAKPGDRRPVTHIHSSRSRCHADRATHDQERGHRTGARAQLADRPVPGPSLRRARRVPETTVGMDRVVTPEEPCETPTATARADTTRSLIGIMQIRSTGWPTVSLHSDPARTHNDSFGTAPGQLRSSWGAYRIGGSARQCH